MFGIFLEKDAHGRVTLVIISPVLSQIMHLSKMTAALLDDLDYIVDPTAVSMFLIVLKL